MLRIYLLSAHVAFVPVKFERRLAAPEMAVFGAALYGLCPDPKGPGLIIAAQRLWWLAYSPCRGATPSRFQAVVFSERPDLDSGSLPCDD